MVVSVECHQPHLRHELMGRSDDRVGALQRVGKRFLRRRMRSTSAAAKCFPQCSIGRALALPCRDLRRDIKAEKHRPALHSRLRQGIRRCSPTSELDCAPQVGHTRALRSCSPSGPAVGAASRTLRRRDASVLLPMTNGAQQPGSARVVRTEVSAEMESM